MLMRHGYITIMKNIFVHFLGLLLIGAITVSCASSNGKTLLIGGIPDQDASVLQDRFNLLAEHLTEEAGVTVKYVPSVDYAAVVTGFKTGDIDMAWYGGLTGVQARLAVPNSIAIAQRPSDEKFLSAFIAKAELNITELQEFQGRSFTFGSESSTSGNLMPRYFLDKEGLNPERDFSSVNYSGSHDKTWKLVEAGTFDGGALNAVVWKSRISAGDVDLTKVELVKFTEPYYDYHWVIRGDIDDRLGSGTIQKIKDSLLALNSQHGGTEKTIMEAFQAEQFIPTNNSNYKAIEDVARKLKIIQD